MCKERQKKNKGAGIGSPGLLGRGSIPCGAPLILFSLHIYYCALCRILSRDPLSYAQMKTCSQISVKSFATNPVLNFGFSPMINLGVVMSQSGD